MVAESATLTVLFPDIVSVSIYMILPRSTWVAAEKNDCLNVMFFFKLLNHFKLEKRLEASYKWSASMPCVFCKDLSCVQTPRLLSVKIGEGASVIHRR